MRCGNISDISYSFCSWFCSVKVSRKQILVHIQRLRRSIIPAASTFTEHPILLHDPPYRLIVPLYTFLFQQPFLHPAAAQTFSIPLVSPVTDHLRYFGITIRLFTALQIVVVSASGYAKEAAHLCHRILAAEFLNCPILDEWPHFLSIASRKSRSSSTSIRKLASSFLKA